jgi:hypothetical protein
MLARMRNLSRFATALTCFAFTQFSVADTIHSIANGAYQHHQSGWIFPDPVGDFSLVGVPQDINGMVDVAAYYARVSKGVRTVASVSVYPPDSTEPETTPASIKAAPVAVEISKQPRLRAVRLTYKDGKTARATVYFVDTGAWIVKIRASVPATDKETAPILEKFVRSQRWDSLQLSSTSCTGAACR